MAEKVYRVKVCDAPECPTPEDDVRRCAVNVNAAHRSFDLCAGHQAPLRALLEQIPRGASRRKTKGIAGKVVPIEEIPKVTRKRTAKKTPGR